MYFESFGQGCFVLGKNLNAVVLGKSDLRDIRKSKKKSRILAANGAGRRRKALGQWDMR